MTDAHCHCHWECFEDFPLSSKLGFCAYAVNYADWKLLDDFDCELKAFGLHPWYVNESFENLEIFLKNAKALGEIGLDYLKQDIALKEVQKEKFKAQLGLAKKYSLPVTIHSVGATKDTLDILDEDFEGRAKDILFHFANFLPDRKLYLKESFFSFSKKSFAVKKALALIDKLSIENILIETDLFPKESDLQFCINEIARLKGLSKEYVEVAIDENFRRFYRL
ncbi:MAG: TatD family hydrolase [Opitutales bacterium]